MSNDNPSNNTTFHLAFFAIFGLAAMLFCFLIAQILYHTESLGDDLDQFIAMDLAGEPIDCNSLVQEVEYDQYGHYTDVVSLERKSTHLFSQCRVEIDKIHEKKCERITSGIFTRGSSVIADEDELIANKSFCEKQFAPYLDKRLVNNFLTDINDSPFLKVPHTGSLYSITDVKKVSMPKEVFIKGLYSVMISFSEEAAPKVYN